ncbi:hypothetical protein F5X97DRAFT_294066 [Nemania serpens]|nr:hypothetical protein F5X97DRAFT_294066 [Nemania serpens]
MLFNPTTLCPLLPLALVSESEYDLEYVCEVRLLPVRKLGLADLVLHAYVNENQMLGYSRVLFVQTCQSACSVEPTCTCFIEYKRQSSRRFSVFHSSWSLSSSSSPLSILSATILTPLGQYQL